MSNGSDAVRDAKAALRTRIRAMRSRVTPEVRATASEAVARRALEQPEVSAARVVLGYHALTEEIDPAPLLDALRAAGARVALPRAAAQGGLTLHWVSSVEELRSGTLGIMEPGPDTPGPQPDDLDLVIVPGVAFDPGGRRLGFGGGFYDRFLARLPLTTASVAIAYDDQVVEDVPFGDSDRPVQVLVTPDRTYRS